MSAQDQHNKEKQDSPFVAPAKWRQGTFGTILTMPWPWPPARDLILSHANLPLGTLTLVAQRDARVRLELCASEAKSQFISCPIVVPHEHAATFIAASWRDMSANMIVGRDVAFSTESPQTAPAQITISGVIPNDTEDFSEESARAVARRRGRLGGTHPKPGRRRRTKEEMLASLCDELRQVIDLLDHIRHGGNHHLPGLASRLRLLTRQQSTRTYQIYW
jgi:hypothetical protein